MRPRRLLDLLGVRRLAPTSWSALGASGRVVSYRLAAAIDPARIGLVVSGCRQRGAAARLQGDPRADPQARIPARLRPATAGDERRARRTGRDPGSSSRAGGGTVAATAVCVAGAPRRRRALGSRSDRSRTARDPARAPCCANFATAAQANPSRPSATCRPPRRGCSTRSTSMIHTACSGRSASSAATSAVEVDLAARRPRRRAAGRHSRICRALQCSRTPAGSGSSITPAGSAPCTGVVPKSSPAKRRTARAADHA